jgi:glucose/arabinose dehydrogenase
MDLRFSPDGRLWVSGRDGYFWTINTVTFEQKLMGKLTLDKRGDYGLHGFDFDPEFAENGHLYLWYSPKIDEQPHMRVSRFTISEQGRGSLEVKSEKVLLEYTLAKGQHVGGALRIHPKDGKLYVSTGDNNMIVDLQKYFDDPDNQAQNLNDLRGKVLRLNLDGSIPTDNPFYNQPGKRGEIYTRGHRQPFSLHVDPLTGNLYEGENGGDRYEDFEEVNLLKPGGNYGWPRCIGNNLGTFGGTNPIPTAIKPWMTYARFNGGSCVGGPFYRATTGKYVFPEEFRNGLYYGDYNRKSVRFVRVDPATNEAIKTEPFALNFGGGPVAVEAGPDGALYLLEYGGWFRASQKDRVARIVYQGK